MLPGLRFFIGAATAMALLGVVAVGIESTVQLSRMAKLSPLETSRNLAYTERQGWKRQLDPELQRTFAAVALTSVNDEPAAQEAKAPAAVATMEAPAPGSIPIDRVPAAQVAPESPSGVTTDQVSPARQVESDRVPIKVATPEKLGTDDAPLPAPVSDAPQAQMAAVEQTPAPVEASVPTNAAASPVAGVSADPVDTAKLPLANTPDAQSVATLSSEPKATPINVLPRPMPKLRRVQHFRAPTKAAKGKIVRRRIVRAKSAKPRIAKGRVIKPKAKVAQIARPRPVAPPQNSTGYQVTPQQRPPWDWNFNK